MHPAIFLFDMSSYLFVLFLTLIGLTGGIACGKSAVSERLSMRGALIVDADQIAREVLAPHSEGFKQVVARWGKEMLDDGILNRARLGCARIDPKHHRSRQYPRTEKYHI